MDVLLFLLVSTFVTLSVSFLKNRSCSQSFKFRSLSIILDKIFDTTQKNQEKLDKTKRL